jgi:hypothetical protein
MGLHHPVLFVEMHTPVINCPTQHLFITVHNKLHVWAKLSHPRTGYNYVKGVYNCQRNIIKNWDLVAQRSRNM